MKKINFLLASLFISALSIVSCTKDDIIAKSDTSTVQASATINAANEIDLDTGLEATQEPEVTEIKEVKAFKISEAVQPSYPNTTKTSVGNSFPKTFTVDFGTTGSVTKLVVRKGKLNITITGPIDTKGSKMTIEREDYYVNGNKLDGTIEYENITATTGVDANVLKWTRTVKNGVFTNTKGKVFTNSGTYTMKQTAGAGTYTLSDNTYEMISGTHTTTNEAESTVTLTVKETLVKNYSCQFVSQGKLSIVGGILNGVIDFGNGDCDSDYTYTHENGSVYNLSM